MKNLQYTKTHIIEYLLFCTYLHSLTYFAYLLQNITTFKLKMPAAAKITSESLFDMMSAQTTKGSQNVSALVANTRSIQVLSWVCAACIILSIAVTTPENTSVFFSYTWVKIALMLLVFVLGCFDPCVGLIFGICWP
jgi:hypothetical protein